MNAMNKRLLRSDIIQHLPQGVNKLHYFVKRNCQQIGHVGHTLTVWK